MPAEFSDSPKDQFGVEPACSVMEIVIPRSAMPSGWVISVRSGRPERRLSLDRPMDNSRDIGRLILRQCCGGITEQPYKRELIDRKDHGTVRVAGPRPRPGRIQAIGHREAAP